MPKGVQFVHEEKPQGVPFPLSVRKNRVALRIVHVQTQELSAEDTANRMETPLGGGAGPSHLYRVLSNPRVPGSRLEKRLPAQLLLLLPDCLKDSYLGPM